MKKRIMLVDDHDLSLFVTQNLIMNLAPEYQTILIPSGFSALEYIKSNKQIIDNLPDIILLDIIMPVVSGFDFVESFEEIKESLVKKPKIFIVSSIKQEIKHETLKSLGKITNYFTKPINKGIIKEILST